MSTMQIPLTQGQLAIVDAADYELVMSRGKWQARPHGRTWYAQKNIWCGGSYKTLRLHTLLTGWPYVDHRNGNGLDNRRSNLRPATRSQNMANRRTPRSNTSGFKGVGWHRGTGKWQARIWCEGKFHSLGLHLTPEEAARVYDAAALRYFGEFARLNFPKEPEQ